MDQDHKLELGNQQPLLEIQQSQPQPQSQSQPQSQFENQTIDPTLLKKNRITDDTLIDNEFKFKYLKYKSKYLNLKNKFNIIHNKYAM